MLSTRLTFNLKCLASQVVNKNGFAHCNSRNLSSKVTVAGDIPVHKFEDAEDEEELKAREAEIEQKRNKSKLFEPDYNKQHGRPPYPEPLCDFQETLLYKRRMYGKYGEVSNVDPSILWPSKTELAGMKEYEKVAHPFTFQQLVERANEKKRIVEEAVQKEEAEILDKVKQVNKELLEFHKKVAVQKEKALQQLQQKQKLIDQVKSHIGYNIDPRSEKFKEMLETLIKQEKKKAKTEKLAKKKEKYLEELGSAPEPDNKEAEKEKEES